MEGRKRSRALSRTVYSVQKRLLAFVLAAAMILTNVGADLNTALAATSSESVTFSMSGSQLVKAIDEAIANGNEVTAEDLDFTNGKIAEFEKLFFGEGKIYEAFPDPDGGSMDAELRVFVRLPEDADDMYMVTGDEEIIFLYVNNGEDSISCTTEITRMDDGVEKVKKTKRVTVKSYEAAYGDEEVNLISKPVETPAPLPEDTNRPGADETTAPAETESQVETTAPSVDGTTAAPDDVTDETTTAPDETTAADETQATLPDETTAAPEESQTEEPATTEATEEKTQEATEPEKTEAPETEAPEAEAPEAEVSEPVASIIRHNAPLVADNENGDAAGTKEEAEAKEETEAPEPEKEEAPKETEAPTKEEATTAEETEATEAPSKEESTEAADSTDPTDPAQDATDETTTAADGETTVPGTDETTAAPVESGSSSADESETKAPAQTVPDVASPSEAKPTEAPAKDDNVSAAGTSDLVGIGYCSTAKVYVTTINQLKALDDFEGYKISYAIYPEASARIVEGPRGVEEGQALSFGVKNQIGYAVESVTANGEVLTADSITDNNDTTQTVWYSVPEVYEEQTVEVYMTETGEHPAFAESVTVNGVTITATAPEGVIPIGTKLDVKEVTTEIEAAVKDKLEYEEGSQVSSVLAYDINLILNGVKLDNSWSDNGYVTVSFTGKRIQEETSQGNVVEIFAADDVNEEQLSADTAAEATAETLTLESVSDTMVLPEGTGVRQVSFDAEHFTIYIITNITDKPTHTYNFYNGDELINTQIVKDGDTLVEPQIPLSESNQFLGWSTDLNPDEYQVFGTIGVTDAQTIDLHARFNQTYYVYFNNNGLIRQIKQANTGQSVSVMDVDIEVAGDEALTGWTLVEGSTQSVGESVTVANSDINLYPIIQKVNWITYYANGGSYTMPTYVGLGQMPERPVNPTRLGFRFDGWYTDAGFTHKFEFNTAINSDIELYAKWIGQTGVKYTVIHWKQNVEDDGYSFAESQELTGKAGERTNAKGKTYSGFKTGILEQKEISGDGSTIVNIYYDRNVYKVSFYEYKGKPIRDWVEIEKLTISAKYGQNISALWPSSRYPKEFEANWRVSSSSGSNMQAALDVMPLNGAKFYKNETSGKNTYKINHYLEAIGDSGHYDATPRTEVIKADDLFSTHEDHYDITGFTYSNNVTYSWNGWYGTYTAAFEYVSQNNYKIDFYYYRNEYNINFVNEGKVEESIPKQYEADISNVSYVPQRPAGIPDTYEFSGWYDNELGEGSEYSFTGKIMPDMDITLYAKWSAPQFKVTFDVNGGVGKYPNQIVDYGNTVLQPDDNPTREGYTFAGWILNGTIFNFNTEIYENTDLVAKWMSTHKLTVTYDAGEGGGTVPIDTNQYVDGSSAAAKSGDALTHPENKGFIGWKLGEHVYYPGETFIVDSSLAVNDQVTLVAQWDTLPAKTFLTYHANYGNDETKATDSIINNGTITIADGNELFERDGYVFEKWTTNRNGTGDVYIAGDTALLDNVGSNDLYAQWSMCKEITIEAASREFVYDGLPHSDSTVSVKRGSLVQGDLLEATATGSVTNVSDTKNGNNPIAPGYRIMRGNVEVTRRYKITENPGTLTIKPKEVSIIVAANSKMYGEADPTFADAVISGYVGSELSGIDLSVSRSDAGNEELGTHEGVLNIGKTAAELDAEYTNYRFTVVPADFTITQDETGLSVDAEDVTKTYDGNSYGVEPLSVPSGATITYKDAEGNYTLTESPVRKDVGTTTVEFKASLYGYGDAYGSADVTITAKEVSITAADAGKVYGEADPSFADAVISGYVGSELSGIDLSVSRSDAGNEELGTHEGVLNIGRTAAELDAEYTNYRFTVVPADFTITQNETGLSVDAEDVTKTYDGNSYGVEPLSVPSGATITYKDAEGNYTLTESPVRKDVGTTTVEFKASLYGYGDAYGSADVTINAKAISIGVKPASKVYGEADPSFEKASISQYIGNDLDGISLEVVRSDAGNDKLGIHEDVLVIGKTVKELDETYTNYRFTIYPGDFTIKPNGSLAVSASDVKKVYDGNGYGVEPVSVPSGATITYKDADGKYTLTESPTRTNVGTTKVEFKASLYGYDAAYGEANVTITAKEVSITAMDAGKVYGEADPTFADAVISGYVGSELSGIDLSVSRSDAGNEELGTHEGVLNIGKTAAELDAEYTNYRFTVVPADFTITQDETGLSVDAEDVTKTYDGNSYGVEPLSVPSGATITYKDAEGNYTLTESPVRKDVGTTTVEFKASLYGYGDAYGSADVTITAKEVSITAADAGKVYGEADPSFADAVISGYVGSELSGIDLSVSRSDAGNEELGTHEGVLNIGKTAAELDAEYTNYRFTVVAADFTITQDETGLSVDAEAVIKTYDGNSYGVEPLSVPSGATITYKDAEGNYTLTESPVRKDVGTTTVEFKASLYGYGDAYGSADVTINAKAISIGVKPASKVYGEADPSFEKASISQYIGNDLDGISLEVVRSDAGNDKLGIHEDVLVIGKTVKELDETYTNYRFTIYPGDFTIKPNGSLAVSASDVKKVYDGNGYGVEPVSVPSGATITYKDADGKYTLTESPTRTNVGTTKVEFKASLYGYDAAYGEANVTITAKEVSITAMDTGKVYGEADPTFADAVISGYVGSELSGIDLSVSRSDAGNEELGTHEGVLNIGKTAAELDAEYTNYRFTVVPADFTITQDETGLSVDAEDVTKTYDGNSYGVEPLSVPSGATITYKDAEGNYTLTESPVRKDVGTTTVEFKASLYGYGDAYGSADVTITAKEVSITAADAGKVYGEADPSFADAVISGYVGSELSGIDLSVSRSDAGNDELGTHEGVLNIGRTAAELDAEYTNYRFTVVPADFTITQNETGLSVDAEDVTKTYDGNSYGVEPLSVPSGATITYKDAEGNYTLTESPVRKDVGTTTVEFKASLYGYGDAYGSADVTITAKEVSITAADAGKVYGEADPSFADAVISGYVGSELSGIDLSVSRSDAGNDELGTHEGVLNIGRTAAELDAEYTNYRFTVVPADFTITQNETGLSVDAADVTKTYDGNSYGVEPLSVPSGATITYKDAEGNYTLTESPVRKDVGTTTVEFKASLYGYGDAYGSADVTITAKEVSITAADAGKVYGEADPSFADAVISGYVGSELSGIDLSVSRSDAGNDELGTHEGVLNIGRTAAELDAEYTNYRFTVVPADFTITQNETGLSVDAEDVTKTYDGNSYGVEPLSVPSGATITYKDAEGNYTLTESPVRKDVGTTTVEFKASLYGYGDAYGSADVTITAKEVSITAADAGKVYGEADPSFADAVISGYVGSELSGIDLSVSRSDAGNDELGTHEGVLNIGRTAAELDAEYTNYRFTVVPADFTITQNETGLSVDAADVTKTYDGNSYGVEPLSVPSGATITYKDAEGNYTLTESPVRKDVGTTTVEFKASLYGYGDAYGSADVTITAKEVSITAADAGKVYGEADPSFADAVISGYVGSELSGIDLSVSRSDAGNDELGTHEGVLNIGRTAAELDAEYTNYRFTVVPADFTITQNETGLSVDAADVTKTYDGNSYGVEPLSVPSGATITYKDTEGNYTLTESPVRKDVGTTTVEFKASLYGYGDAYGSADVTITAKEVSITAADAGKVYGEADPSFADAVISGYVGSELSGIDLSVSRSDAGNDELGTHEGVLNIGKTAAELDAEYTNYRFTVVPADFTITQNETGLSVDAADVTKTYDGNAYGVEPISVPEGAIITYKDADGNYTLTESPARKDVGTITVEFKASLYGYADAYGDAKVTINTKPVIITVISTSKEYGQQDPAFTGTIEGLIADEDLGTVTYGRVADDVGKENVGDDISLTALYTPNTNYEVTIIPGKLEILASGENAVVVTGRTVTYDGTAYGLTDAHAVRDKSILYYSTDNVTFTEDAPTFTEAGVYVVYVKATNDNYLETQVVEGKVIINKRDITFTAGSANKVYDGSPLTNDSVAISSGTIVDGQTWTVKVTGSQTAVGTSKNVVSEAEIKDGERDVTANYSISYISGDLTVTSPGSTGGGSTGGGGGNPGRVTPSTDGGPGAVTINPEDVPLAQLPGAPVDPTVIDDGEIPLAALPKTGQSSVKSTLTMMMSGIFLMLTAMSKKRKEEDS